MNVSTERPVATVAMIQEPLQIILSSLLKFHCGRNSEPTG